MREIKFRGMTGNENWVTGHYFFDPVHDAHQVIGRDGVFYTVKPETVGEFTGLKDKNGKEIYEGDIVDVTGKLADFQELIKVEWDNEQSAWMYELHDGHDTEVGYLAQVVDGQSEVIGNIYENSELLTKQE